MTRLVFVIDNLSGGGAERIVLTLASTLNNIGHQGIIVTLSDDIEHEIPSDIQIEQVPEPKSNFGKIGKYRTYAKALEKKLHEIHQRTPIDLVISNLPRTDRIVNYVKGFQLYFCIHNNYSSEYLNNRTGFYRWLKHRKLKSLYRSKSIIAVSQGVAHDILDIMKLPVRSVTQIYNPFLIKTIQKMAAPEPATDYGNYVIHVGRINRQKRHDRLLRAYHNSGIAPKVKLLLLGSGSTADTEKVKALISKYKLEESVILHGFEQNLFPYIRKAKALLLSSDFEGFGNVIVESLICGTPVISTDCPSGPSEILTGELSKYLIPTEDEGAYASAIKDVLASPPNIDETQLEKFSAEVIAKQYLDLAK